MHDDPAHDDLAHEGAGHEGAGIERTGWIANALFAATAIPAAAGVDAMVGPAIAVALVLFLVACGLFVVAFAIGLRRSAEGENVAVANLFLLQGSAPRRIRRVFAAQFAVCVVLAVATASWEPFSVLVPMFPAGLAGLWAARHGSFPPRSVR